MIIPHSLNVGMTPVVSSLVMVPVPCARAIVTLVAPDSLTKNVSFASTVVSPLTFTVIVCVVWPGVKVNVPVHRALETPFP